jgi:hypothetical protein
MRKWKYTKADYVKCAEAGLTKAEASRKLGVSPQCIADAAKRHGLTFKRKCGRGGINVTPEQEERLGTAMKLLAVDENKRMRDRMGGTIAVVGLQDREARIATGKSGGRPRMMLTPEEIKALKERKRLKDEAKEELRRLEARIAELKKI